MEQYFPRNMSFGDMSRHAFMPWRILTSATFSFAVSILTSTSMPPVLSLAPSSYLGLPFNFTCLLFYILSHTAGQLPTPAHSFKYQTARLLLSFPEHIFSSTAPILHYSSPFPNTSK